MRQRLERSPHPKTPKERCSKAMRPGSRPEPSDRSRRTKPASRDRYCSPRRSTADLPIRDVDHGDDGECR
jgi:hypothetical protein